MGTCVTASDRLPPIRTPALDGPSDGQIAAVSTIALQYASVQAASAEITPLQPESAGTEAGDLEMRVGSIRTCIASIFIVACALAQAPAGASELSDRIAAACPGAEAFLQQEKARAATNALHSESPPSQPALRDELSEMVTRDQAARNSFLSSLDASRQAELAATDAANLAKLKSIVAKFGFPTLSMVGREGVQDAWLLTQHADTDLAFQKQVLALIQAQRQREVRPGDIAMLEDRIRVNEGKPQRYGSNFDRKDLEPTPIEDPEHVDERRAQLHLMPMAAYRCVMQHMYQATSSRGP